MERLTDVGYWDKQWQRKSCPQRLLLYRDYDYETVRLLNRAAGSGRARVLELGAGGSRVLPYLARKFGYQVFGTDFSFAGCDLLRANLALAKVDGGVICEDIFNSSLAEASFDLVFSCGLIEHFENTRAAIAEHSRLVRPAGSLVIIVPNFQGLQGRVWKRLAPPLWSKHKIFGPQELAAFVEDLGFEKVCSGYLGSFFFKLDRDEDWIVVRQWPRWLQALANCSVRLLNGAISFGFRLSPFRPHWRLLSAGFFALGIKPER